MKRKLLILLLLFTGPAGLFIACQQDSWQQNSNGKQRSSKWQKPHWSRRDMDQSAWQEAQANYALHKDELEFIMTRTSEGHPLFEGMMPAWKQSYTRKGPDYTSIETVLRYSSIKMPVMAECEQKYRATGDQRYLQTLTRLVILLYDDGREADLFFMTLSPSVKYWELTRFRPFYITYPERDKRFDGKIHFHNLQGEYVNGWLYRDGKIIYQLLPEGKDGVQTRGTYQNCDPVYKKECEQTDEGEAITDETGEATVTAECKEIPSGEYNCTTYDDGRGDSGDGGGDSEDGGGSGTSGYNPGISPGDEKPGSGSGSHYPGGGNYGGGSQGLEEVFVIPPITTDGMTKQLLDLFKGHQIGQAIQQVEAALTEVLRNQTYKTLYDKLVESQFNSILINETMIGVAAIQISSGNINLVFGGADLINAENMQHELYHLFQVKHNDMNSAEMRRVNGCMEFEQSLFQDIQKYMEVKENWRDEDYNWACWRDETGGTNISGDKSGYMSWLGKITNNGTGYPTNISQADFNKWAKMFSEVDNRYSNCNYPTDYPITIPDAFK